MSSYVFLGNLSDMRGHSHPPLNAWILGGLLAVVGDIREVPFHAAYIVFSLIAALAMWSLAQRFSPHPLWATLLFIATPAFVINGNSFESDLPFLAFWMAAVALFVSGTVCSRRRIALALASLTAYQAVFLTPILWLYVWLFARRARGVGGDADAGRHAGWRSRSSSASPRRAAGVGAGGILSAIRLPSAGSETAQRAGLTHACLLAGLSAAAAAGRDPGLAQTPRPQSDLPGRLDRYLLRGALVVFFAGSARYLLPMAAPVALLVSRLRRRWLAAGFAVQMTLSLALAVVNYQHWDAYRPFVDVAAAGPSHLDQRRLGLRYYLESRGRTAAAAQPGRAPRRHRRDQRAWPIRSSSPPAAASWRRWRRRRSGRGCRCG